jgi:hypothetical protein
MRLSRAEEIVEKAAVRAGMYYLDGHDHAEHEDLGLEMPSRAERAQFVAGQIRDALRPLLIELERRGSRPSALGRALAK